MAVQAQFQLPMCGLQDWMVINHVSGLETDFYNNFKGSQRQNLCPQQQSSQMFGFDFYRGLASSSAGDSFVSMAPQTLDAHLEMQMQEVEHLLQAQNERLRSALQEQRKQQLAILLKSVESKALFLMRKKDEDLTQARKKNMELEACLRKTKMENESWQRLARKNEAMVIDLTNTLEQIKGKTVLVSNKCQDAESFCHGLYEREEKEEEYCKKKMACKRCNSRSSCVLFLPCRHLCSCNSCESFLSSCPVCKSVKEASMNVFWV